MENQKLTPGEQLYAASNNADFWTWLADKKENDKKVKAERKKISDEKFRIAMANQPKVEVAPVVIDADAPKYSHNRFGVGVLVCEDETTITLSFDGKIQKMVKKFTKLTLI
jgi:hypothetical protein